MKSKGFRLDKAELTPSVCPYCSVGCAIIVYTINGRIVNIEGDPQSPHSEGCLCPKGASTLQLHYNRSRASRVLHRKPGAKDWDEVSLDWAMKAKLKVARIIHVDLRFTRTSAKADIYASIRSGLFNAQEQLKGKLWHSGDDEFADDQEDIFY